MLLRQHYKLCLLVSTKPYAPALKQGANCPPFGSAGSHVSVGSYVEIGAVLALVAADRCPTSHSTLVSSRLRGPRAATAAGAAGLIGGVWWWSPNSRDTAFSRLTHR